MYLSIDSNCLICSIKNFFNIFYNHFFSIAEKMNKNGDYFPLFGICLGFELLTYVAANRIEHRTHCNSMNQPLPLEFTKGLLSLYIFNNNFFL